MDIVSANKNYVFISFQRSPLWSYRCSLSKIHFTTLTTTLTEYLS